MKRRIVIDLTPAQLASLEAYAVGKLLADPPPVERRLWAKVLDALRARGPAHGA